MRHVGIAADLRKARVPERLGDALQIGPRGRIRRRALHDFQREVDLTTDDCRVGEVRCLHEDIMALIPRGIVAHISI